MNYKPNTRTAYALKQLRHKRDVRWTWTNAQWLKVLRRRERQRRSRRLYQNVIRPMLLNLKMYGTSTTLIRSVDSDGKETSSTMDLRLGHDGTVRRVDGAGQIRERTDS
jgi:hypothetical protein